MEGKILLWFVVVIMLAQGESASMPVSSRALSPSDIQHARYGVVRLSAEAELLRLHSFLLFLELDISVRNTNLQIFDMMNTLGVDAETISELKTEMTTRGENSSSIFLDVYQTAEKLSTIVADTNNHIVNELDLVSSDLITINEQLSKLNLAYDTGKDNVILNLDVMQQEVENEINQFSGPEVEEIRTLMTEARSILQKDADVTETNKVSLDQAADVATQALQVLIDGMADV